MNRTITYHDATVDGHARIARVIWDNPQPLCHPHGPEIVPPDGIEAWVVYDRYRLLDACVYVLSERGD
jgi:hypothetical protein